MKRSSSKQKKSSTPWQQYEFEGNSNMLKSLRSVYLPPPPSSQGYSSAKLHMGGPDADRRPLADTTNILRTPQSMPRANDGGNITSAYGGGRPMPGDDLADPRARSPKLASYRGAHSAHMLSPVNTPMTFGSANGMLPVDYTPTRFDRPLSAPPIAGPEPLPHLHLMEPPSLSLNMAPPSLGEFARGGDSSHTHSRQASTSSESKLPSSADEIPLMEDDGSKPPYSYAMLIGMSILRSSHQRLTLSQIYDWIKTTFSWYRDSKPGWQNSIRHNLSLNKAFLKQERPKSDPGKGNYWVVAPGCERQFMRPRVQKRTSQLPKAELQLSSHSVPQAMLEAASRTNSLPPGVFKPSELMSASSHSRKSSEVSSTCDLEGTSTDEEDSPLHEAAEDMVVTGAAGLKRPHSAGPELESARKQPRLSDVPILAAPPTLWMPHADEAAGNISWRAPKRGDDTSRFELTPPRGDTSGFSTRLLPDAIPNLRVLEPSPASKYGSPNTSLRNHRAYIQSLTTPSLEMQKMMASPARLGFIDDEDVAVRPGLSSPHKHDARRRLFEHQPELVDEVSDVFGVDVCAVMRRAASIPSQNQTFSTLTPVRRPFDTPIRDQTHVFSPFKLSPSFGSPRRS